MPEQVSRKVIPTQLVLPGFLSLTPIEVSLTPIGVEQPDAVDEPIAGQTTLFAMPVVAAAKRRPKAKASPRIGAAGEAVFRGACHAQELSYMQIVDPGHEGFDCFVEGQRVQVKATSTPRRDGRLAFSAGHGRSFSDYRGRCDYFAFVVVMPRSDLYGRMRIMDADSVISRWPGSHAYLTPTAFPNIPDLAPLLPPVTDAVIDELLIPR